MRQISKVNFGDTITLAGTDGERTICRVSVDDLPLDVRAQHALDPLQWTVYCRPLSTFYKLPDAQTSYLAIRVVFGHGGMSLKRDVDGTVFSKTSGCGSSVEVRARFVDVNGVTIPPATGNPNTTAVVNAVICPGADPEAEPQLWWANRILSADGGSIKLPNSSVLLKQQRLRRVRARQSSGGALFFQTHDSVVAPVALAVPRTSDPIQDSVTLDIDWGHQGIPYSKGLWACLSSTESTFTGTANSWNVMAQLYQLDSGDGTG
jgi:hypothetical protein